MVVFTPRTSDKAVIVASDFAMKREGKRYVGAF